MNTNITIRLGNAQMDVAQKLGTDQGKAVNELVAVSIEAAHDNLATNEFVRTELDALRLSSEAKLEALRQSNDNKFWIMITLMVTGFAGIVYTIITINATIMALIK